MIGQDRAVEAVAFGISIRRRGFNIFALGPSGHGKSTTVQWFLGRQARKRPVPDGWCYVYNFGEWRRPIALRLPPGRGRQLAAEMKQLVEDLLVAVPAAFEAESFENRRKMLSAEYEARAQSAFEAVSKAAGERGLTVIQRQEGLGVVPVADNEVMTPDAFRQLPEEKQAELRSAMEALEGQLRQAVRDAVGIEREARRALASLEREVALLEVQGRLDELRERHADLPGVLTYFDAVQADVLRRLELFHVPDDDDETPSPPPHLEADAAARSRRRSDPRLRRYYVNVLVDHDEGSGAPVVALSHPTMANLLGRIEYEQRMGGQVTDFSLIQAGGLHRANGGYLVIEADELLKEPHSWDALKRALRNEEARIEAPPGAEASPLSAVILDPAPIPLDCKVILIGEPGLYYALHYADPDFQELFKVPAEFGSTMPRSQEADELSARFIATVARREGLLALDRAAVARVIEFSSRLASDSERLSTDFLSITDLLRESDFWAAERGADTVAREDVDRSIAARIRRADLARERVLEAYEREIVLLETTGAAVGQANALTVVSRGDFAFGLPVRVTARAGMGQGKVIDIEREVALGGPLHSKGVLILSGFLRGHFLPGEALAMSASLTFEQSYHGVDGDSASSVELYALLSALSNVPIRQSLAVTGSVNQTGDVQAIGGANEKIEGFFDVCRQQGLTGDQGVMIPASNVQHLMLRADVVAAAEAGEFHIYPITTIAEGIELLTGVPAGTRGDDGLFPEGTLYRHVEDRLAEMAEKLRKREGGGVA